MAATCKQCGEEGPLCDHGYCLECCPEEVELVEPLDPYEEPTFEDWGN